jgi:hypothetical protein
MSLVGSNLFRRGSDIANKNTDSPIHSREGRGRRPWKRKNGLDFLLLRGGVSQIKVGKVEFTCLVLDGVRNFMNLSNLVIYVA